MGGLLSALKDIFASKVERRIIIVGLDGAGKTTMLYKLKLAETVHTIPTIGFNVETVNYKNINFTLWDVGGQDKIRPLWKHYYHGVHGVIFMVDSNDQERIEEAAEELHKLLNDEELHGAVLLVFANKQDVPSCMSVSEISAKLELQDIKNRHWYIQSCSAVRGDGLYEGLEWFSKRLNSVSK